jgi:surface polysaccharide O-acyltransferase-like enzyme
MRKAWLDYLRVIAVVGVVAIHVTADYYKKFGEISQAEWWLANVFNASSRFAVPLFVMVSGAVLLGKSYSLSEFYKKRAVRLLPPLIFWNLVYLGIYLYDGMDVQTLLWLFKAQILMDGYIAPHLWYLAMFASLMLFVPFVNNFITGTKPTSFDLSVLMGWVFLFFILNSISLYALYVYDLQMNWFKLFPWYLAYFIAGYYIDNYSARLPKRNGVIAVSILGLMLAGALLNYYAANSLGIVRDYFAVSETGPLVFLTTCLIFLLVKNLASALVENKFIAAISETTFGIYLIHEIFISAFYENLPDYFSRGLLYIPVVIVMTSILSFIAISLIKKIRFLRAIC